MLGAIGGQYAELGPADFVAVEAPVHVQQIVPAGVVGVGLTDAFVSEQTTLDVEPLGRSVAAVRYQLQRVQQAQAGTGAGKRLIGPFGPAVEFVK